MPVWPRALLGAVLPHGMLGCGLLPTSILYLFYVQFMPIHVPILTKTPKILVVLIYNKLNYFTKIIKWLEVVLSYSLQLDSVTLAYLNKMLVDYLSNPPIKYGFNP